MKKIFLFFLLLSASGAFAQISPSVYKLPGDTVKVQNLLYVKGVKVDSTTYSTKALLSTYLTKAQVVAGYYPLSSGNTDATNIASNTSAIALLAPLASPVFTGGVSLSGNITKAANFGTTGLVFSAPAITVTSTTSTGTIANQGSYAFGIPTLAASSATTLTNASTVYIDGNPVAGTNVTITNPYSLYVNGAAFFNGGINGSGGLGTTNSSSTANFLAAGGGVIAATSATIPQFAGSTSVNYRAIFAGSSNSAITVGNNYANVIVGAMPFAKAGSGTNAWVANMVVDPIGTVGANGSTITNTASLYVGAGITAGTNNYSLFVAGLTSTQGLRLNYNAQTANYTALITDNFIDCTANSFTVTLPLSAAGQEYVITNSGAGTITVQGTSSQLVNGSASVTIAAGATDIIYGTGTAWRVK